MRCKIFNCDKVHKHMCCAQCPSQSRCKNPCLNSPERCGLTREETPKELIYEHGIKLIGPQEASGIIEAMKPEGLFYLRMSPGPGFVGIDNRTGHAWTEEFLTIDACIRWLVSEAPREEFEA